jgi:hypothetical protein
MEMLSEEQFRLLKTSDTCVIYGSGWSINKLTEETKQKLAQFDSISFNWYCKSNTRTTFYLVREQANMKKRTHKRTGEDVSNFIRTMNSIPYENTCLIIHDLTKHSNNVHHYSSVLNKFNGKGVVVLDQKSPKLSKTNCWAKESIFKTGVYHGMTTMTNVMHIVINLGYKRVIFVGVDLYDSRYFWLPKNKARHSVKQKGQRQTSKHQTALYTINLIIDIKKHHDIELLCQNRKSLLAKHMPVWKE